jgi:hydrogenase expression/formation protein HypC
MSIDGDYATVDYGGMTKKVNIALVKEGGIDVDDYVIVHAGCAIQRIDPEEAKETLELMTELLAE